MDQIDKFRLQLNRELREAPPARSDEFDSIFRTYRESVSISQENLTSIWLAPSLAFAVLLLSVSFAKPDRTQALPKKSGSSIMFSDQYMSSEGSLFSQLVEGHYRDVLPGSNKP